MSPDLTPPLAYLIDVCGSVNPQRRNQRLYEPMNEPCPDRMVM